MAKRRKQKAFDFSSYHPPDSFRGKDEEAHFLERVLIPYIKKLLEGETSVKQSLLVNPSKSGLKKAKIEAKV